MDKILSVLEQDARFNAAQIAKMLGLSEAEVAAKIAAYEQNGTILGYKTLIDWEKIGHEGVTALIEVKVTPQMGMGFDKIAEKIYRLPEVENVYLMSGGFDLTVLISGKSLKEVSRFVSEKLAPMPEVLSTATHFVLKRYKEQGVIFEKRIEDSRGAISL